MSVMDKTNLNIENESSKTTTNPTKKTKGEIGVFNRVVWNYMRKQHKLTDSELLKMKEATCPAKVNGMAANLIRYFDPDMAKEKGITVEYFESLNEYPELILFEGYYILGRKGEINIKKWEGAGRSFLEEKKTKETITEVGVVIEKTAAQKWLGSIGAFMLMGGFMLVLVLVVIIVVVIALMLN